MKKGIKIKPEEIIVILRQVEVMISQGKTFPMACRGSGVSEQTYYRWRKQYGGMQVPQAKELKNLQLENARLKKAIAELTLEKHYFMRIINITNNLFKKFNNNSLNLVQIFRGQRRLVNSSSLADFQWTG